jgi:hypothetical protein
MSVWSMLTECINQLDEPFRRSEIIGWFRRHHPQVNESTLAAHIQAATANAANRAQNHPNLARRAPLLQRIDHGLYARAVRPDAVTSEVSSNSAVFAAGSGGSKDGPGTPARRTSMRGHDRVRRNIEALVEGFDEHVRHFEAANAFSGPSVYFHHRAIERRRIHTSVTNLLADERFLEYLYAVLPSWGTHRMGPQRAKVRDFGELVASLRAAAPALEELWPLHITRLAPGTVHTVTQHVWQVIAIEGIPAHLRKSITWDQGSEMAQHAALTLATDIPVYFAHAHSPWERGTNENTNRLVGEYFPKRTEITSESSYLWEVADELNGRPRAILGLRTPAEAFAELLLEGISEDAEGSFASTD